MSSGIIVAVFPSREVLARALEHLHNLDEMPLKRAAVIAKAATGKTLILDDDLSAREGGLVGGAIGALLAALGTAQLGAFDLPGWQALLALLIAALLGGVAGFFVGRLLARFFDMGFRNELVEALAQNLKEGHPALVLELAGDLENLLARLRRELHGYRAEWIEPLHIAMRKQPPSDLS